MLAKTLNEVENALSGTPYNPAAWESDGRLYPPRRDSERAFPAHPKVRRFRTRGHNVMIGENGSIEIREAAPAPLDGKLVVSLPGADGRRILEQ